MAQKVQLLCLFFLPHALSFFLRVHSPLHHHLHHDPHHHHLYHHDHDVHDYRAIVRHHGHFFHRPVHHHHVLPPLHRHHLHSYDHLKYHHKYQEPVYHSPKYESYEVPKYSSYSSDDQSYHHDLHHRADDGEDVGGVVAALGEVEVEGGAAQLCQHLEGATRALCYLCGEEDEDSGCWEDPCWLAREEEQEECRLQLEAELLSLEKKNLESGDWANWNHETGDQGHVREEDLMREDGSNENLGATSGLQSFVPNLGANSDVGTEINQEVALDLGAIKELESITELGRGLEAVRVQDTLVQGQPVVSVQGKITQLSDIMTSFTQKEEGVQDSDSQHSDRDIDPSVLELLTLNPITDPV